MLGNILTLRVLKGPELCRDILLPGPPFSLHRALRRCCRWVGLLFCMGMGTSSPAGVWVSPCHLHLLLPGGAPALDFTVSSPFAGQGDLVNAKR